MANSTKLCGLQSGERGECDSPLSRLSRAAPFEDLAMDEEQVAPGAPRKAPRDSRASYPVLSQGLYRCLTEQFDELYDESLAEHQRLRERHHGLDVSRLISIVMRLARIEGAMRHEELLEEIAEGGFTSDEEDDSGEVCV